MLKVVESIVTVLMLCVCAAAGGAMWYVDDSVSESGDGKSPETAFKKIQEGIDAAGEGDTVTVSWGTYLENIQLKGNNIILTSTDPLFSETVSSTVIDGGQAGSVVTFLGTEDETCVLAGFTVRNGSAEFGGGIFGGAFSREAGGRATIRNNVIANNSAGRGGGLAYCNGRIVNNIISLNTSARGGGLRLCHGVIENNVITANTATGEGAAGLDDCYGLIQNNIITGNQGVGSDSDGGLGSCHGIIQNNLIAGNSCSGSESWGGGLSYCYGTIQNNTIVFNSATGSESVGGGLAYCGGAIRNCIIWGNTAQAGPQLYDCSQPTYCCIQEWTGGVGNTNENPLFVGGGDYRLQPGSPCLNRGMNYYWCAWPQRDLNGNCRLAGERVDMGCYEHNSSPDSDGDLLADADESAAGTDPADEDTDDDSLRDGLEILRGSDPLTATGSGIVHVPLDSPTIQAAVCLAVAGDEIVVGQRTYVENVQFCGMDVVLRSSDPRDAGTVASTTLDGGGAGPVVSFVGSESEDCVLSGFTIRNGKGGSGGGICGGSPDHPTNATIRNNAIFGNASSRGGGLAWCDGIVESNIISGNSADRTGGGLGECDGIVRNNIISGNSAWSGGGLHECNGAILNSTIAGNSAEWRGGGLSWCGGGAIINCIIWGNTAAQDAQLYYSGVTSYCCIQGGGGGEGSIASDPQFVAAEKGDFRLLASSPCIDAGNNSVPDLPGTDIAGMRRIMFGGESPTVDMGAYEHYINQLKPEPGGQEMILTWSSLAGKSYSIFYSGGLSTWHLADDNVPSAGNQTTSWIDDGSKTGVPPSLAPRRFYRILENP